jgi:heterodisulfide reductase subunit A-like polyferredoxin
MVLCVGPAESYCSRICCTTALKNALALKRIHPQSRVTILFKDIRTYGFKERLYTKARNQGVLFLHYDADTRPRVDTSGDQLVIQAHDPNLDQPITLSPDLFILSNPVVPPEGARSLATQFKVPIDKDGFLLEAHVKLRPVDFPSDGIFMAGMAHYPKLLDESIVQAKAAAARAARVLSRETLTAGGIVAHVDPEMCVGCLTCVRVCPFDVPRINADEDGVGGIHGAAFIEPTVCQGCGNCVAECPAKAIHLAHFEDNQILVKVDALLLGA